MKGWTKEMVRVTVETNYPFCNGVTKDEALQLAHDLLCELKQTRKETAKKFAERLKAKYGKSCSEYYPELITLNSEQLDEICEEITEGKV